MSMRKFLGQLLRDDRGQSTTEYILILAVVVMIAMKFKQTFGDKLGTIINNVTNGINEAATINTNSN